MLLEQLQSLAAVGRLDHVVIGCLQLLRDIGPQVVFVFNA